MKDEPYLQFPLCALSFGHNVGSRLNAILDYGVVQAGLKLFGKLSAEQRRDFVSRYSEYQRPIKVKSKLYQQWAAFYGAVKVRVSYARFDSPIEVHRLTASKIRDFETRHGRDARVRIKTKWLFSTRDGQGLSYREFSVLCAVYSAIGDKQLAIVTRARIRRCALGYRTAAIMQTELATREDKAPPLTDRQLRDTIERLHRNRFFARCTVSRRLTYYSNRLDNESLRKKVKERRTYPGFFRATQSVADAALTDSIKRSQVAASKLTKASNG